MLPRPRPIESGAHEKPESRVESRPRAPSSSRHLIREACELGWLELSWTEWSWAKVGLQTTQLDSRFESLRFTYLVLRTQCRLGAHSQLNARAQTPTGCLVIFSHFICARGQRAIRFQGIQSGSIEFSLQWICLLARASLSLARAPRPEASQRASPGRAHPRRGH